jgi:hypothetical protein
LYVGLSLASQKRTCAGVGLGLELWLG